MITLKHVLVPIDFSIPSEAALSYGRALARNFDATLSVLHVLDNHFLSATVVDPAHLEVAVLRRIQSRLTDDDRTRLGARGAVDRAAAPADAIVAYARRHEVDLIVTGTNGRTGVSHLLMGSVAADVVRHSPCPVLTVRQRERDFVEAGDPAAIGLRSILVATDFGEAADVAVTYGRALARQFGATMHILHVTDNVYMRNLGGEAYVGPLPGSLQADIDAQASRRMEEVIIDNDQPPLRVTAAIRTSTVPDLEITQYAKDHEIDLVVLGTHGRGALGHLLMGNVAERVVRTAPCPVLTVRHPEREFVRPDALVSALHA